MGDIYYQVFDTETSNLSPMNGGEIAEIAVITCRNKEIIDLFHTYYSVVSMHPKAQETNGLSIFQLQGWPSLGSPEVQKELREIIKYPLFAHNISFDARFLKHYNIIKDDHILIDTLKLCRTSGINLENNKLSTWTAHFGITHRAHGALSDTFALCQLIESQGWQYLVEEYIKLKDGVLQ